MPNPSRDSDSEDLQTFLRNFHKEIEDGSVDAKDAKALEDDDGDTDEERVQDDEDDDDKYFIDDEGNCYIKATPKKQNQLKRKLKTPTQPTVPATETAAITVRSATRASSSATATKGL